MQNNYYLGEEWVKKSYNLPGIDKNPWLMFDFQALGRLDTIIEDNWQKFNAHDIPTEHELQISNDTQILARLWVLAAYEIVRILKNKDSRYNGVYKQFRKVRIPLAKYEKPSKNKFSIARLAWTQEGQEIGWMLDSGEFISRKSLVEGLLKQVD